MANRPVDLLIAYRVIKMLVTPFDKQPAFKYGIIDKNGKVLPGTSVHIFPNPTQPANPPAELMFNTASTIEPAFDVPSPSLQ